MDVLCFQHVTLFSLLLFCSDKIVLTRRNMSLFEQLAMSTVVTMKIECADNQCPLSVLTCFLFPVSCFRSTVQSTI